MVSQRFVFVKSTKREARTGTEVLSSGTEKAAPLQRAGLQVEVRIDSWSKVTAEARLAAFLMRHQGKISH